MKICNVVQAQLMYLDSEKKDIKMYINSGGGSVIHGLGMVDVMRYINSDIRP
jgi:ATP-dependent protease ClpP protease subunit